MAWKRRERLSWSDFQRSMALIPPKESKQLNGYIVTNKGDSNLHVARDADIAYYAEQQSRKEWNVPTPAEQTALGRVTPNSDAPVSLTSLQSKLPGQYIEFLSSDGKQRLASSEQPFYVTTAQFNPEGNYGMQWELTIVLANFDLSYRLSFNVGEKITPEAAESRDALMRAIAEQTATSPVGPCILVRGVTNSGNQWYALASAQKAELPF